MVGTAQVRLCPPYGTALDIKQQQTSRGATRPRICILIRAASL
jgi:hypothetical protein